MTRLRAFALVALDALYPHRAAAVAALAQELGVRRAPRPRPFRFD